MNKKLLIILALVVILLASCETREEIGKITAKDFTPAHTKTEIDWTMYMLLDIPITKTEHVPAKYTIRVEGTCTKRLSISEAEYNSLELGDNYSINCPIP